MVRCDEVRASLSALADDEDPPLARGACEAHVASCDGCRTFADKLPLLSRMSRLAPAVPVPDVPDEVLAAARAVADGARTELSAGSARLGQLRGVLALVGIAQALLAVAALLDPAGHLGRELATWELALGVAFVVAAWQPIRSAGVLPMVGVLAAAAVVSGASDLLAGATTLVAESSHLVEVGGVALVWALSRATPTAPVLGRSRA